MEFKIINLNVWLGGKLMPQILDFLEQENADILNLQEVRKGDTKNPDIEQAIKEKLEYEYSFFTPAFFDTVENCDSGNLILSKYPIVKTDYKFLFGQYKIHEHGQDPNYFSTLPRIIQHATIDINGTKIYNFNVHGIWAHRDGSDSPNRLKMSNIVCQEIKDKKNVILTGDFNSQENTKTINNIENYLTNIFKDERKSSFNMKQKTDPGYGEAVVDFIFTSNNFRILSKSMPNVDISDHLPLVANLAL